MLTVNLKGNKPLSILITALIILIWLGIFVALIKLDVGGFGSKVLTPVLKDVPVINKIYLSQQIRHRMKIFHIRVLQSVQHILKN